MTREKWSEWLESPLTQDCLAALRNGNIIEQTELMGQVWKYGPLMAEPARLIPFIEERARIMTIARFVEGEIEPIFEDEEEEENERELSY
jgi:hypothetical protein